MLKIFADETKVYEKKTKLLVIGCFINEHYSKILHKFDKESIETCKKVLKNFNMKFGLWTELPLPSQISAEKILFFGLGNKEEFNSDKTRIAVGKIIKYCKEIGIDEFSLVPFDDSMDTLGAIVEGSILSSYSFEKYKTNDNKINSVSVLVDSDSKKLQKIFDKTSIICHAVNFGREISNLPPNECSPEYLAKTALGLRKFGIRSKVIDIDKMKSMGLNGIVSVGTGSNNCPNLIIIEYIGTKRENRPILLVGKAVTFDSGGISLKPSDKMDEMKFDKCGGVNIIAIMKALASLKVKSNVVGIVPAVENMPSGFSYRPSDIIKMYNGKNVEVLNTDAEGRMILADALAYGIKQYNPKLAIDMATLTGACIIALGSNVAGIMGTGSKLIKKILDITKNTDEKMWELPLYDVHHEQIKSKNADIKNVGGRTAGAITAAAFLSNFVGDTPWAHIDIAGTAWNQDGTIPKSYNPNGATGFGIRTIVKFIIKESEEKLQ